MMRLLLFLLAPISLLAFADELPPKPPEITAEMRARFWRASHDEVLAREQHDKATAALTNIIKDMAQACGEQHVLSPDAKDEPICAAKPKPEKKETPK